MAIHAELHQNPQPQLVLHQDLHLEQCYTVPLYE